MSLFIQQAVACFSFRGFRPKVTSPLAPIAQRIPTGKRVAYLSMSGNGIRTASITATRKGPEISELESLDLPTGTSPFQCDLFTQLPTKTNCGLVIVQLGDFDRLEIAQSLRRASPQAELITLSHDARTIIGPEVQSEMRYAALTHPVSSYGFVANTERMKIDAVASQLEALKLRPLRIQNSTLALMANGLSIPEVASGKASLVIVDHGHITFFRAGEGGQWMNPRVRQNIFQQDPENRNQFIESIAGDNSPVFIIDTKLGGSLSEDTLPIANYKPFGDIPPEHIGIHAALSDELKPNETQTLPSILRGLSHDIGNVPIEMEAVFPPWLRTVAVAFWLTILGGVGATAFFAWSERAAGKEMARLEAKRAPLQAEINQRKIAAAELDHRQELAISIDDWVSTNAALQPVIFNLLKPLTEKASVRQLSLARKNDSPNGEYLLTATFSADQRITNSFITAMSLGVKNSGWLFGHPNLTPSSGAITLEAPITQPRATDPK